MNNPRSVLVLCLLSLMLGNSANAQWVQTNNFPGGYILSLIVSSNGAGGTNIFAGTYGFDSGVFRSTNNGTSWTAASTGLPRNTHSFGLFAVSGTNLFAGTWGAGVFLSTNNGASWEAVNTGLTDTSVIALAVSGTSLFASTYGGGVFLSTNSGSNWIAVNTGLPSVSAFAVSGTNLFAGTWGAGVFLSTNNGASWTAASTGLPSNTRVDLFAVSGTSLFVGTFGGGVFHSTNNGASWEAVNTGLTDTSVIALAVSGENLFAGTHGGVFLSTNNGTSWTTASTGLPHSSVTAFAVSGTNLFAGTWGAGVFLSTYNGASWTAASRGLPMDTSVTGFAVGPSSGASGMNLFAFNSNGVFRSNDNGASFEEILAAQNRNSFIGALGINDSGHIFVATGWFDAASEEVIRSTNNGVSWTNVGNVLPMNALATGFAVIDTNLFASTNSGVYLLTNSGGNWTPVNTGLTNTVVSALAVSPNGAGGRNLFAGTNGGGVFLSTNNGTSWTAVNTGLTNNKIYALTPSGTNIFAGTSGGVFLSTDNGTSWTAASTGLPTPTAVNAVVVDGTKLFAGTWGAGVFLSTNSGASWTGVNTNLTNSDISALAVSGTNLFAGTPGGVWRRPLSEMITSVPEIAGDELPMSFELNQNFPNPFNPSTTIRYGLPYASVIQLTVFNTLGQEVATLVQGAQEAGNHEARFDASGLSSGVYFYRLSAGQFVQTRKLVLLR